MAKDSVLNIFMIKHLYDVSMQPIVTKHDIRRLELDILLFLSNHPQYDTASEIIYHRGLSKSHVSTSIQHLIDKHLLKTFKHADDKKKIHLQICDEARDIIQDGKQAQKAFFELLYKDFSKQEKEMMASLFDRMNENIKNANQESRGRKHDI